MEGIGPLSLTATEYLREQLPGQAFKGYDISDESGLEQVGTMLGSWFSALATAFSDPVNMLRNQGKAQYVKTERSFVRLNDPDGHKYGGGLRVKSVLLHDNWSVMNGQFSSTYGQKYTYETTEILDGKTRTISSGVASYEPGIGGEENPFQRMIQVANSLPLGPTSYGAIEMPVLDAFFPAPVVGYSKVTVESVSSVTPGAGQKSRSGIGKQVTEFYTAKDYPVQYYYTPFDAATDIQSHTASTTAFFYKYAYDYRTLSQGFLVATNDMHGKMKSQSSYAENDPALRVSLTENFYRNTGSQGLNDKFDFVHAARNGEILPGNMGIDIELMTDLREFTVASESNELQFQLDLFPVLVPVWLPFPWPITGESENTYRAVTTTKLISYHAVLDSVSAVDKGSQVGTKNMILDAETGNVVVNRTNNEFRKPVYTTSYPAYWAYSGMGLAYKNIDAVFENVNFYDGKITSGINSPDLNQIFESGDELYIYRYDNPTVGCAPQLASGKHKRLWVFDKNKDYNAFPLVTPDLIFIDKEGKPYTNNNVKFRIIRSGKRNMLDADVAGIMSMVSPVVDAAGISKLSIGAGSNVINASAVEFKEKWQTDNGVIKKYTIRTTSDCTREMVEDCNGFLDRDVNPYLKGLIGNFQPWRDLLFYANRTDSIITKNVDVSKNGFLADFKPYWGFSNNTLTPDYSSSKWVWKVERTKVNARGMELENKDALGIYQSCLYGYQKSMPVAIAGNSRYNEIVNENFEDYGYKEALNGITYNECLNDKHLNFEGISGASIIPAANENILAHTGKNVLKVIGNPTVTIPVNTLTDDAFSLALGKDTTKTPADPGDNITLISSSNGYPSSYPNEMNIREASRSQNYMYVLGADLFGEKQNILCYQTYHEAYQATSEYQFENLNYIVQPENGYVTLAVGINIGDFTEYSTSRAYGTSGNHVYASVSYDAPFPNNGDCYDGTFSFFRTVGFDLELLDEQGNPVSFENKITGGSAGSPMGTLRLCLEKGNYKVITRVNMSEQFKKIQEGYDFPIYSHSDVFNYGFWKDDNTLMPYYKSLTTQNGCISTKPLAATQQMFNGRASVIPGKKILVSAWVKESCTSCTTYTNAKIGVKFDDNTVATDFRPAGPIVDGWQRIEAEVTVPAQYENMKLSFSNNNGIVPAYFDDIRIHPYNANMKSYVYDPVNLRLVAELDANNYATFYEYDEEGTLIRTKVETRQGIKTISETRSSKQKQITTIQ